MQKIAAITGRPLGKLEAMGSRKDSRYYWFWGYDDETSYGVYHKSNSIFSNPVLAFRHSPAEVYGSRALELYRVYTIELRFALK